MTPVLYTAVLGDSDRLKPLPRGVTGVCFTDNLALAARGWTIRPWQIWRSPRASARFLKLNPHVLFAQASCTAWIDASFSVIDWPGLVADADGSECAAFRHPDRVSAYQEAVETIRVGQSPDGRVTAQVAAYRAEHFAPTSLTSCGVFVRRQTARVVAFCQIWERELERWGLNDQISVDYAAWKAGLSMHYLRGSYRQNPYLRYDIRDHRARRTPGWAA